MSQPSLSSADDGLGAVCDQQLGEGAGDVVTDGLGAQVEALRDLGATLAADGVNVMAVHLGSHSGTHADAPYHFVEGGARIDQLDPRLFVGTAVVMDVRGKGPRERITVEDLRPYENRLHESAVAVVRTGWEERYGTPEYYDHPFLDRRAAWLVLDAGVRTVAIDALRATRSTTPFWAQGV